MQIGSGKLQRCQNWHGEAAHSSEPTPRFSGGLVTRGARAARFFTPFVTHEFAVTKTETETEAAFMMFNVVESGKAQNMLPILNFFDIRFKNLVTKSTAEGQAAYMLYNVMSSGLCSI